MKYNKVCQIIDGFMNFSSQLGFFMPFLGAVKRPVGCTEEEYRMIVYELAKEMVIRVSN